MQLAIGVACGVERLAPADLPGSGLVMESVVDKPGAGAGIGTRRWWIWYGAWNPVEPVRLLVPGAATPARVKNG